MSQVTQEFRATGDDNIARAYEKLAQKVAKLEEENQKLRNTTKAGAEEAERARQKAMQQLDEELRKTQDLKRARQELIVTTNFVRSTRDGGDLIPSVNFTRPPGGGGFTGGLIPRPSTGGGMIPWRGRPIDEYGQVFESARPQSLRMANPFGAMGSQALRDIGSMAAAWISVEAAMRAVNYQQELMVSRMKDSAEAQRTLARGHAEIVLATFGGDDKERQRLFAEAERISGLTGVPQALIAQNLGRQTGRGVGLSVEQIVAAQEMAARLGRHTPEQIEPMATAIQQTMRIGKLSATDAASLIQSASAAAFIGEPWQQARFLQQTISGGLASVAKPTAKSIEEVLELGAFITQAVGEERGEAGRTSSIALLAQLQEFREGRGAWEMTGPHGMKIRQPLKNAPTDPRDMIEWLQQNPRQARRFTDKATFERMFEGTWRNLILNANGPEAQLFRETASGVGVNPAALAEQLRAIEQASDPLKTASEAQRSEAGRTNFDALSTIEARRKEAYDIREEWLGKTYRYGRTPAWLDYSKRQTGDAFGMGAMEDRALSSLRRRRQDLDYGHSVLGVTLPAAASAEREQMKAALDKQIQRLEEIRDEIKQLNSGQPGAGPAMNGQRGTHSERAAGASGGW